DVDLRSGEAARAQRSGRQLPSRGRHAGDLQPAGQRQPHRHFARARRRRDRRVRHGRTCRRAVRRDRARRGDAHAQRHGHRPGRRRNGTSVYARDGDGAVEMCPTGERAGTAERARSLRASRSRQLLVSRGYTFVELLVVATIVIILASAIMPLAKVTATRTREAELRRALREMRTAIDKYKDAADLGQIGSLDIKVGSENYPADLQTLVDGVSAANDATGRKLKF